jgi:RND family efflux transporter MFP subunit
VDELSSDLASLKIDRTPAASRSSTLTKIIGWLLALAALVALLVWAYPLLEAQLFKTEVKTAPIIEVSPSLAVTSLTSTGYVVAERRSKVGAHVAGRVAKLLVREGSLVKQGDLLVELDASDQQSNVAAAQARVASAEGRVAAARATLRELEVQLARQKELLTQKAAARSVVEDLEARLATRQAEIESALAEKRAAQAQVELARVTLGHMTVVAPLDGTVVDKPLDVGETVDTTKPLMEIADLDSIVVEIDVPEARLSLVTIGGPCEIVLDAFGAKRFKGKVRELGKRVNRSKATVTVKVEFAEGHEGVLPDMSARVSFLTEALDPQKLNESSKVVVPAQAVATRGGKQVVFVVEAGVVREEAVQLGEKSNDGFELRAGPKPGARVVVNPVGTLASGQRVKERNE